MIDFTKLEVFKNELLVESPYTDYEVLASRQNKGTKESKGILVDKVHEIWEQEDFYPSGVNVLFNLDMKKYRGTESIVSIAVGRAGYVWVPKHKLELKDNVEINKSLMRALKGHIEYYNELEQEHYIDSKYMRTYDINNVEPLVYRDIEGRLMLTWKEMEEK